MTRPCWRCDGDRTISALDGVRECPVCHGSGEVEMRSGWWQRLNDAMLSAKEGRLFPIRLRSREADDE